MNCIHVLFIACVVGNIDGVVILNIGTLEIRGRPIWFLRDDAEKSTVADKRLI